MSTSSRSAASSRCPSISPVAVAETANKARQASASTSRPIGPAARTATSTWADGSAGRPSTLLVPYADWNVLKFPDRDQALEKILDLTMLSDIFPTGFHDAVTAGGLAAGPGGGRRLRVCVAAGAGADVVFGTVDCADGAAGRVGCHRAAVCGGGAYPWCAAVSDCGAACVAECGVAGDHAGRVQRRDPGQRCGDSGNSARAARVGGAIVAGDGVGRDLPWSRASRC